MQLQNSKDLLAARNQRATDGYRRILDRLDRPDRAGLDETRHKYLRLGAMYGAGMIDATFGLSSALKYASEIEAEPLHQVNAWRIRMVYYLRQGNIQQALQCRNRAELLQIQNSPSQCYEGTHLYPELLFYTLADDLIGIKHTIDGIEKMAERFKSWEPVLHYALGEYQRIRGDYQEALVELERSLNLGALGRHTVWPYAALAFQRSLYDLGRYQEAKAMGEKYLEMFDENKFSDYICNYVRTQLALVAAKLGNHDDAVGYSETAIENLRKLGTTGLNLGLAYETRARVAILMNDCDGFLSYTELCAEQYLAGDSPSLIAKYEKLILEARIAGLDVSSIDYRALEAYNHSTNKDYKEIRMRLSQCNDAQQRADLAINILTQYYDAKSGYFFGLHADGLQFLSSKNASAAPEQLLQTVRTYLEAELEDSHDATVTAADEAAACGSKAAFTLDDGTTFETILVYGFDHDRVVVVGVAALVPANGSLQIAHHKVVHAVSDALLEKGDVVYRYAVQ